MDTKIPKIIHYCWFGNAKKPDQIKRYMQTWCALNDYEIIEWNESNININDNKYLKDAYNSGKWAFVSDYVRLKALYEYGGIYLDTDVEVKNKFDDLLKHDMFLGFIFDYSIGTAVIGAKPKHPLIKKLLEIYDEIIFCDESHIGFTVKRFPNIKLINNNDLFTIFLLTEYSEFELNNKYQVLENLVVYPKKYFEIQPVVGSKYTVHWCEGSWNKDLTIDKNRNHKKVIKSFLVNVPFIHFDSIFRNIKNKKNNSKLPFYSYNREISNVSETNPKSEMKL